MLNRLNYLSISPILIVCNGLFGISLKSEQLTLCYYVELSSLEIIKLFETSAHRFYKCKHCQMNLNKDQNMYTSCKCREWNSLFMIIVRIDQASDSLDGQRWQASIDNIKNVASVLTAFEQCEFKIRSTCTADVT